MCENTVSGASGKWPSATQLVHGPHSSRLDFLIPVKHSSCPVTCKVLFFSKDLQEVLFTHRGFEFYSAQILYFFVDLLHNFFIIKSGILKCPSIMVVLSISSFISVLLYVIWGSIVRCLYANSFFLCLLDKTSLFFSNSIFLFSLH